MRLEGLEEQREQQRELVTFRKALTSLKVLYLLLTQTMTISETNPLSVLELLAAMGTKEEQEGQDSQEEE